MSRVGYRGEGHPLRVLFVGFGNVGRTAGEILRDPKNYPGVADLDLATVGLITRTRGCLANPSGVDLPRALEELKTRGRFAPDHPDRTDLDGLTAARTLDYHVLVEISPLNVAARGEPAISHVRAALSRGRHAVTANKGPVSWAHGELCALAEEKGAAFLKETTVMDGVPVFNLAERCMQGCRVLEIEGILNSTSNWVLAGLEEGLSLEAAVRVAQEAGIAEADPSHDLEGWDGAVKVSALANGLMGGELTPDQVERVGMSHLTPETVASARTRGRRFKMLCRAWRDEEGVLKGRSALEELPLDHFYASVSGAGAALTLRTDLLHTIRVVEEGGTSLVPTAYGVLSDLLALRDRMNF